MCVKRHLSFVLDSSFLLRGERRTTLMNTLVHGFCCQDDQASNCEWLRGEWYVKSITLPSLVALIFRKHPGQTSQPATCAKVLRELTSASRLAGSHERFTCFWLFPHCNSQFFTEMTYMCSNPWENISFFSEQYKITIFWHMKILRM